MPKGIPDMRTYGQMENIKLPARVCSDVRPMNDTEQTAVVKSYDDVKVNLKAITELNTNE